MHTKPETGENGRNGSSANFSKPLFTAKGVVEPGKGRGTELGFPTANIPCEEWVPNGIFAGEVVWNDESYGAALYRSPNRAVLEAHMLDFSDDLYGEKVTIIGYQKIRGHKRFDAEEELMKAIAEDIKDVRECLRGIKNL